MKKKFSPMYVLFVLLTLSALALTACGAPDLSGGAGDEGGSQATPVSPPPTTSGETSDETPVAKGILLDPANAADADSLVIVSYLFEGLVKLEADGVAPVLAESWTVSDDGLDYIFVLRRGVTFHDGTAFNADAVIANFNRWFDKDDPAHGAGEYEAWASIFGGFKGETGEDGAPKSLFDGAEKVDDYTVLIHLTRPDTEFLTKLVNPAFFMASPAAFRADYFGTSLGKTAGSGPYQLTAWSDSGLTLEPFADYWGGAPSGGKLDFPFK